MTDAKKPWEQNFDSGASGAGAEPWKQDYGGNGPRGLKGWSPEKEPGVADRFKQGVSRAVDSAQVALSGDAGVIAKVAADQQRDALPQTELQRQMAEEIEPYNQAAKNAEGFSDNVRAWGALGLKRAGQLISNPAEAGKMIVEQLPNSIPGMAGGFAGAKAGAAVGTAVGGPVGTVIGGIGGGLLGGFAGGYGLEKGASVIEQVQEKAHQQGVDLQDQVAARGFVAKNLDEIDAAATRKAVGTAGTDAALNVLTMGAAGLSGRGIVNEARALAKAVDDGVVSAADATAALARLEAANAARNTVGQKALRGGAVVGAEMAGEGVSEAVGQKYAYGEVDPGQVIDEALLGLGQGGAMALGGKAFRKAAGLPDNDDAATRSLDGVHSALAKNAGLQQDGAPNDGDSGGGGVDAKAGNPAFDSTNAPAPFINQGVMDVNGLGPRPPAPVLDTQRLDALLKPQSPSEAMGLRTGPDAGPLENAAALSVDTGATAQMQGAAGIVANDLQSEPQAANAMQAVNLDEVADPYERAMLQRLYDDHFADGELESVISANAELDTSFDFGANVNQLLADAGATPQEIEDAQRGQASAQAADRPGQAQENDRGDFDAELSVAKNEGDGSGRLAGAEQGEASQQPLDQQAAAPGSQAEGANVATLAQLNRKKLAEMSDDELQQLSSLLPADHSRQQKIQQAIQTRATQAQAAINQGVKTDGTQTDQAQQAVAQPAQAGAAQAGQPAGQGLNNGATPAENDGRQASAPTAPQAQAQELDRQQRAQRIADAGAQWTRMPAAERSALVGRLEGVKPVIAKNMPKAQWENLNIDIRRRLADAMDGNTQQAPATAEAAADTKAKATFDAMGVAEKQRLLERSGAGDKPADGEVETEKKAERKGRIESTLNAGGYVQGDELRTSNGMTLMKLTAKELESVPVSKVRQPPNKEQMAIAATAGKSSDQPASKAQQAQAATENVAKGLDGDALERKADEVMEKVVAPGMLNLTRDQVRALIQEKGMEAADKTIADYQESKARQAETIRKYSEAKEKADSARKAQAATEQQAAPGRQTAESAYTLPAGSINDDWRDEQKREPNNPGYAPTPRQQRLMNEVKKVLDSGAFYNDDVTDKVAKALGVSDEVLASNRTGVQGGDFGYDVYHARKAVEAQAQEAEAAKIRAELNLRAGDKLGTLIFNDFKQTNSVEVVSVTEDGRRASFKGKRGAATVTFEATVPTVKFAIERAHEKGKRKDSYEEFIAGRAADKQAAEQPPAQSQQAEDKAQLDEDVRQEADTDASEASYRELIAEMNAKIGERQTSFDADVVNLKSQHFRGTGVFKGLRSKKAKDEAFNDAVRELRLSNESDQKAILEEYRTKIDAHPYESVRRAEGARKTREIKAQMEADAARKAAQPITRADVEAAQQQAAAIIGSRIDAMSAGDVNKIAKKFLPTMGMKPTMSKANNKAAMTDSGINLEAAAAEVGAALPAEVTRALQADMEGRVVDVRQAKPAAQSPIERAKAVGIKGLRADMSDETLRQRVKSYLAGERAARLIAAGKQTNLPQYQGVSEKDARTLGTLVESHPYSVNTSGEQWVFDARGVTTADALVQGGLLKPDNGNYKHELTPVGKEIARKALRSPIGDASIGDMLTELEESKPKTGNNGDFDPANPDIRFSFAGQQAATADTMALSTAQQRLEAGEDAEAVRRDTGWFRGADGKWRFEINDADARLKDRAQWTAKIDGINAKRDAALQALWQAEEQRNDFLRTRGESPSRISSETKKTPEFKALAKALKNAEAAAEKAQDAAFLARQGDSLITVGDVLSHPALFAAYPGIANVRVDINDSLPAGNAAYAYELRAIELSGKSDAQQLLSTLLHEIQHGIQHIEGFAMGGNEDSRSDVMQAVSQQRSLWADVYAVRRDLDAGKKLETVLAEWQDFLDAQPSAEALRIAQDPELETAVALQNMETLERQYAQLRNEGRWDTYRRLAGEVEARNTQARQGMNDAQRRATPPSQTADVADSDVIVMFNGKVAMSAPTPANAAPDAAPQPPRTPAATIRASINRAYGKLLGQLEAKGLVTLAQTEAQAIEAAAQARAKKTGGDVAQIKRSLTAAMQGGTDLDVKRSAALSGITFSEDVAASYAGQTNHTLTAKSKNDVAGVLEYVVYEGVPSISMVSVSEKNRRQGIGRALVQELQSKFPDIEIEWGMLTEDGAALRNSLQFEERPNIDVQRKQSQLEIAIAERSQLEAEANKRRDSDDYSAWIQTVSERWNELHDEIDELESYLAAAGPAVRRIVVASETQQPPASIDIKRSANGAVQGFFDQQTGQSFLIADNLSAEAAPGVLMHEVGIHMAADGSMKALFNRAATMLKLQKGNPFMKAVQARMDAAGETSGEEAAAYIAEAYENDRANAPASVQRWLADLLAAVKAWMFKKGIMGADRLTVADVAAVARSNAKSMARDGGATDGHGFGPAFHMGEDAANYAANPARRPGTAQDKAVMQAIADGKNARDVLRMVANGSKDPFLRQVARLLLKAGITPNIQFGYIGKTEKGDPIHGQYRGKSDTIAMAGSAEYAAERIFMHEAMHAATMRALAKPGLVRLQLQKLLEHVRKQPGAAGFYGLKNLDEFVVEVFTNPDFQAALRKMSAPAGNSLKSAWDSFVRILRGILGLSNDSNNALSQALELGVEAVRQDMVLRRQGARASGRANAGTDAIDQTQTAAFKRWFGDGGVRNSDGDPQVFYHGGAAGFSGIRAGGRFGGAIFVREGAESGYGEAQHALYLNSPILELDEMRNLLDENPQVLVDALARDVDSDALEMVADALTDGSHYPDSQEVWDAIGAIDEADAQLEMQKLRGKVARALGFAAVRTPDEFDGETVMVLEAGAIKSATGNNGNFDPEDADILNFGADDVQRNISNGIKAVTAMDVKQLGRHKLTDWLKLGLQFLGRRQLVDVYGDLIPQMRDYDRLAAQMEADKNESGAEADELVRRWAKLPDEGKLADLMHEATLAQVDADSDVEYVAGDDKAQSAILKNRFKALSPEAQAVYREARDGYKAHHEKVRKAIRERIERSELSSPKRHELLAKMDDDFFQKVKGVYFPLARFGRYVTAVKDGTGQVVSVSRAETMPEAESARVALLKAFPAENGFSVGRVTLDKEFVASHKMVGRGFMTDLYRSLEGVDLPTDQLAELEDTLGQLYLSSLPDLSWAKHGIHRKGTPGFSQDARRAFAQNMFHGARYLAKLRYSDVMQDSLDAMQEHVDEWGAVTEEFDQPKAQRVVDEMLKRHDAMMNPKSNPLSTALTSFGFLYYLGLSPAAAMVNLSQTALVAYPVMAGKWGYKKSADALLRASKESVAGKNNIRTQLTDKDEIAAYEQAVKAGVIDVTMAHDLAGISQGEDQKVSWALRPVMRMASYMFHQAELFNRQSTFMAAFRLAREEGATPKDAYEQAVKATYDGHFDYGAANRPRVMQGNVARVVLLFKQYAQNMIFTLARQAYQSVAGKSPEERRQARKVFAGLLTTHAMAAGVLGLPLVGPLLAAASMLGSDDDEPWDAEVALRNMLAEAVGQKPAEVLAKGVSRLTPWDVSGRVGLDKLIFPDLREGLEGQRWAETFATGMLGPVMGIGTNAAKAAQKMGDGDYGRALEDLLPIAARNPIKAARYWFEGAQDRSGVAIKDEVSSAGALGQLVGFSPSEVRLAQEGKTAVMDADRRLNERRAELTGKFAKAAMKQDQAGMDEARQEIAKFNEKNPGRRITAPQLWQSVRRREQRIREAENGVYLPSKRRDAMEFGAFAFE